MAFVFSIIFPVFGLVLAGYGCRRMGVLGPASATELNRFVVWLALPALLFQIMAKADWSTLYQPGFTAAFAASGLGLFALVVLLQRWRGKSLADASVEALAAAYPNTGYMGFPLTLVLFGNESLVPTTIATMLVVCVMFGVAIVAIEAAKHALHEGSFARAFLRIGWSLLKNPLIASPLLGIAVACMGWPMPGSIDKFLSLLAAAASPCALVSLGLFLASHRPQHEGTAAQATNVNRTAWSLTALKLVALPAITWCMASQVFGLSALHTQMAVILSALPTGTGPYMLADMYQRPSATTARTILFSTVASVATIAAIIHWLAPATVTAA
ncbi:AEC family transporter [Lampropedia aestuarii]|uniref:AEC family transporter n=1 Tax=Lampropedia aestuarii TaxID=2562762 RepID=UPI001F0D65D5|nr:AEC family transporter [Lampropedia aestuarii]